MRTQVGSLLVVLALASGAGCKGKGAASDHAPDPAALKAQAELAARRDALMAQRKKLETDRAQVEAKIKEVSAGGGDTTELVAQRAQLDSQIEGQSSDLAQLSDKLDQVVANGGAAAGMAQREASMGGREKTVATREATLAERERVLAQREGELAKREKETCGAGAPPQMIIQQVAPPVRPGGYSRKEVEPLLLRARQAMAKKGLMTSDLGAASGLDGAATKAMADNDFGAAYLAASQLLATVDQTKIDRAFITAKYKRLNDRFNASKVDDTTRATLEKGMQDVVQLYGDGDHAAANKKLNALAAQLR